MDIYIATDFLNLCLATFIVPWVKSWQKNWLFEITTKTLISNLRTKLHTWQVDKHVRAHHGMSTFCLAHGCLLPELAAMNAVDFRLKQPLAVFLIKFSPTDGINQTSAMDVRHWLFYILFWNDSHLSDCGCGLTDHESSEVRLTVELEALWLNYWFTCKSFKFEMHRQLLSDVDLDTHMLFPCM